MDEWEWIAQLRALTRADPAARNLMDDAAFLTGREGHELVISTDAMVEGVHFTSSETPDIVARRLLRTNLSDLAAKAAEPIGYFLTTAFPPGFGRAKREAFIRGLAEDGETYQLPLLGGDTTATSGPLVVSATVLGWSPSERRIERSGACDGDLLMVCGTIGDGYLRWRAMRGELADPGGVLARRFQLPEPLLCLRAPLRLYARAAADVSDGLIADAGHIAEASGCGLTIDLDAMPVSPEVTAWLGDQPDRSAGLLELATGGDDYALVCAVSADQAGSLSGSLAEQGVASGIAGRFVAAPGLRVTRAGRPIAVDKLGWTHSRAHAAGAIL